MPFIHITNQGPLYPFGSQFFYLGAFTKEAFSRDCPAILAPSEKTEYEELTIEEFAQLLS